MFSNRAEARSWNQGILDVSSTRKEMLGARRETPDGRIYRYAKAGAVALVAGACGQAAAYVANHAELNCAATAIGANVVTVTLGGTAVTLNQYRDGYLLVNKGTGIGYTYHIESHAAQATTTGDVDIVLSDTVRIALVASGTSEVTLHYNKFDVVTESTTVELVPIGIAPRVVPISNYYWAQTGGYCGCHLDATSANASRLIQSNAVAGNLEVASTTFDVDSPVVGTQMGKIGVANELSPVWLELD